MKNVKYIVIVFMLLVGGMTYYMAKQSRIPVVAISEPVVESVSEPIVEVPVKPVEVVVETPKPITKTIKSTVKPVEVVKVEPVKTEPIKVIVTEQSVDNTLAKETAKKELDFRIGEWTKQIQVYRDRVTAIGEELRLLGIELDQKRNEFNALSNPTDEQRKAYNDYLAYYSQKTNALGKERDTYPAKIAELQQYIDLAIADYELKWGK